jgi:hypothetical protein
LKIVTITRRIGVLVAALALVAVSVTPAFATQISQSQVPTTAAEFIALDPEGNAAECEGEIVASGDALWHFILTGAPSGETITLTANFTDGEGNPVPPMTDVGEEASTSGTYHFYITTPDDYTLVDANTDVDGTNLVLSHVCLGDPPVIVPEAPASALLVLSAAALLGLLLLRRRNVVGQTTTA